MHGLRLVSPAPSLLTAIALSLALPSPAHAIVDVTPMEATITHETTSVTVINKDEHPAYVTVSLARLDNPGVELDSEHLKPTSLIDRPAAYAFPFKLSLGPGQSKRVYIKPLHPVRQETLYRLRIDPVATAALSEGQTPRLGAVVVNMAYSILVRQLPEKEKSELTVQCTAQGAQLIASGNVRYVVKQAKVNGSTLPDFRVYPGTPRDLSGKPISIPEPPPCN